MGFCGSAGSLSALADMALSIIRQKKSEIMTQEKLDMYLMTNQKYLPADKAVFLKETLKKIDDSKFTMVSAVEFKDPTTLLLVSIFLGALGIDRFMLGDTGMGILRKH